MDLQSIGVFLALLRRERGWTQQELGEKLGVSNKTVSRWETGVYLPDVAVLAELSRLYAVSINELLAGRRLSQEQFPQAAEDNLQHALAQSAFSLPEKRRFWEKKWQREHRAAMILCQLLCWGLYGYALYREQYLWGALCAVASAVAQGYWNNQKMIYVEKKLFDDSP